MKRNVAHDPVALVEDADDRDALRHRRHCGLRSGGGSALPRAACGLILLLGGLAARTERERDQQRCGKPVHAYSGIHGS
ncbi:MAG: hypothetical protein ACJ8D5_02595 [Sphingomicrobium sp.]